MTKTTRRKFIFGYIAGALFVLGTILSVGASDKTTTFATINAQELKSMIDFGGVIVIDVRDADAYLKAHIPGALQIPLARIEGEVPHLAKDKPIVTYCTCPNEESSGQAAMILGNGGVKQAFALKGGLAAWAEAGNPVKTGKEK
jgi:rhodanese-related sulfurtransferase